MALGELKPDNLVANSLFLAHSIVTEKLFRKAKWVGPFYIGDRLSPSLYRVWGFPTPEKLGCIYPSSLMKPFAKSVTPLSFKVLEQ